MRLSAELKISNADHMTSKSRKEVADWLRCQADYLEADGDSYDKKYTAKLWPVALKGKAA